MYAHMKSIWRRGRPSEWLVAREHQKIAW